MTKVIILGEATPEQPKKPIELKLIVYSNGTIGDAHLQSDSFDYIELINKNTNNGYDVFYAYNKGNRNQGALFLGHFNDGIV